MIAVCIIVTICTFLFLLSLSIKWSIEDKKGDWLILLSSLLFLFSTLVCWDFYKKNSPINQYHVTVLDKYYHPSKFSSESKLLVKVKETNTIETVKIDNFYKFEQINIGDTLIVKGYDETYLQY